MKFHHICIALLVALLFGLNATVVKIGIQTLDPLMYTAWRYVAVWPLLFFIPRPKISWKNFLFVSATVGGTGALCSVILYLGIGPGIAGVLLNTQVFFTILLSIWFWREWPRLNSWIGMFISFIGVACIVLRLETKISSLGILLVLCAALCWAFCNAALRKVRGSNIVHIMVWVSAVLPIPLALLSMVFYGTSSILMNPLDFPGTLIGSILYSGLLSGLVGITLTGILFQHYPASMVAPFSFLTPISGLIFAYLIVGETLTWLSFFGCLLVLGGLLVNQWKQKEKAAHTSLETGEL